MFDVGVGRLGQRACGAGVAGKMYYVFSGTSNAAAALTASPITGQGFLQLRKGRFLARASFGHREG